MNHKEPTDREKHIAYVEIPAEEYDRINDLLAIESFEDMEDDDVCIHQDVVEGIFYITFDNGTSLSWDLCSGKSNYWDDVVFHINYNEDLVFDCDYRLDNIEFMYGNEEYYVYIIRKEPM